MLQSIVRPPGWSATRMAITWVMEAVIRLPQKLLRAVGVVDDRRRIRNRGVGDTEGTDVDPPRQHRGISYSLPGRFSLNHDICLMSMFTIHRLFCYFTMDAADVNETLCTIEVISDCADPPRDWHFPESFDGAGFTNCSCVLSRPYAACTIFCSRDCCSPKRPAACR